MLFALFVTCATTLLAFGTLAFSSNPVLHAIGLTVSVGALAAFVASAASGAQMKPRRHHRVYRDQRARPRQCRHARCAAPRKGRTEGRTTSTARELRAWIGRVAGLEDEPITGPLADFDCRNNRLAHDRSARRTASGKRSRKARRRYGAKRIAVLLGTSTSGILQTELAYRRRDAEGNLPAGCAIAMRRTSIR